jgi:hypothetical protein
VNILVADCSLGEFGWELMSWQGRVRQYADEYDKVIVCTTAGLEPLYRDFTDEFLVHSVPLLRDCFEKRAVYDKPAWKAYRDSIDAQIAQLENDGHTVKYLPAKHYISTIRQRFVKFGDAAAARDRGDEYDIVIHARNKESNEAYYRVYNWPQERWNLLVKQLKARKLKVAAIGTKEAALLPVGADDLRGIDLQRTMDVLAAAKLAVGPSSGPMHLASLCKTPHLVWTGTKWSSTIRAFNNERYEWKWNPFRTFCRVLVRPNANVTVDEVFTGIESALADLKSGDVVDEIPGSSAATKMISFWQKRAQRDANVTSRHTAKQTKQITDKLRSAFGGGQFDHGLDFGCGTGRFTDVIAEHCDKLTAVDLVDTLKEPAVNVEFQLVGFPTKLELPDASVDFCAAILVFQHIVDEHWLEDAAAELRRVLADSAMVVIIDDSGKPSWHVKQRQAEEFKRLLDFGWYENKTMDLDGEESHHIVIGSHRKA